MMNVLGLLILLLISPVVYGQEISASQILYDEAIAAKEDGYLLKARQNFENILKHHTDFPQIHEVREQWGDLMWMLLHADVPLPESISYEVKSGDTLGKIAKANHTTVELIKRKNKLTSNLIRDGQTLLVWTQPLVLRVNKTTNRLDVELKGEVIKSYMVSTGKSETTTPLGEFYIQERYPNPVWFHHGDIVPAGSAKNFLGTRWLGFNMPKYGIHGTIFPELIGQSVSGGCIRMKNTDVEELYDVIPTGTKVIVGESVQ